MLSIKQPIRLLIMDDKTDAEIEFEKCFFQMNLSFDCQYSNSAAHGIEFSKNFKPDCILLNYDLPDLDSFQFLRKLNEDEDLRNIPSLIFMSHPSKSVEEQALILGVKKIIKKNEIDLNTLAYSIQNIIQNQNIEHLIQKQKSELNHLAYHDPLTSLLNRPSFHEILSRYISNAKRNKQNLAVFMLNLDHFHLINDVLGHEKADILLKEVANRINSLLRHGDIVARFEGDQFGIILTDLKQIHHADLIALKLLRAIESLYDLNNFHTYITASIGIAIFPKDAQNVDDLIRFSDHSMRQSKKRGPNSYCFYSPLFQKEAEERIQIEKSILEAIEKDTLELYYQPQYALSHMHLVGFESLLRCPSLQGGFLPPQRLFSIAQEMGILQKLCQSVIKKLLMDYQYLSQNGLIPLVISINASAKDLKDAGFLDVLIHETQAKNINTNFIQLEITESDMIYSEPTLYHLKQLVNSGFKVSIDNFGTRSSSLSQLKAIMPIHLLKIDKSFIQSIDNNSYDLSVVKSIIDIAKNFNLQVIAEGIETQKQFETLQKLGCQFGQGYFFHQPMRLSEAVKIVSLIKSR